MYEEERDCKCEYEGSSGLAIDQVAGVGRRALTFERPGRHRATIGAASPPTLTRMFSRVLRRRSATAAWIYVAVACGIAGTVVAARVLGLDDFGVFATALAAVGFFQVLLDLTVEESLTKYGFRYVAAQDWGRLRRLFRQMLLLKLVGGAIATVIIVAFAPVRRRALRRPRGRGGAACGGAAPTRPVVRERCGHSAPAPQSLRPAWRVPGRLGRAPPAGDRHRRAARRYADTRRDRHRAGDRDDRHLGRRRRRAATIPGRGVSGARRGRAGPSVRS